MSPLPGENGLGPCVFEARVAEDERIATEVVLAFATATDADPEALPPLYDAVDPDAIEQLFSPSHAEGCVRFSFHDHVVVPRADRTFAVYEES